MKLLIEPPTWLGDAVMASGAINAILNRFSDYEKIILGSQVAIELFKNEFDQNFVNYKNLKTFMEVPKVDIFISFRRSLFSKIIGLKSKKFYSFKSSPGHMVKQYSKFVNNILNEDKIYAPYLPFKSKNFQKKVVGINPGATYGSAKRWYPEEFAKVANEIGKIYDEVIIFGGPGEEEIVKDIEKHLNIKNYQNLCGKLSIKELCEYIGGLSLFITNDSGPMHIAAAFNVPIVAVFGPTDYTETHPWSNNYKIVTKNLDCAPCKKRECPFKHHNCMKEIKAEDVIKAIKELN